MVSPKMPQFEKKQSKRIKFSKGHKYRLRRDATFFVPWLKGYRALTEFIVINDGWVWIGKGWFWDGASGPTWDTKSTYRGSLFHDAIYWLMRRELLPTSLRDQADKEFVKICAEDGMWKIRQKYFLVGVRRFAASAAHPDNVRKVFTAP